MKKLYKVLIRWVRRFILQAWDMKIKTFIITFSALLVMAGCKPLRKLISKDGSMATTTKRHAKKETKFIEGIEITPGTTITSKHKTSASRSKPANNAGTTYTNPYLGLSGNIEKANWLQMKYAIMLDATVEKLTNITLLQKMDEWWGTGYCLGGSTKNCIDCSAFTVMLMRDVYHVSLPRTAQEQYNVSEKINDDELKEGDLVFFHTGGRRSREISHVGVYIINNKFANASTSNGVTISDLDDPYWKARYRGAGRVSGDN